MRALPVGVPKLDRLDDRRLRHALDHRRERHDAGRLRRRHRRRQRPQRPHHGQRRRGDGRHGDRARRSSSARSARWSPRASSGSRRRASRTAREELEARGYEVLTFHMTGTGGRSMESLMEAGYVRGVLDVTTTELARRARRRRLLGRARSGSRPPGRLGMPQVVSLGALDMVNFGPRETVPAQFDDRNLYVHNAQVTLMRTTPEECAQLGREIGEKLSRATGPTALFIPLRGVSMIAVEGGPFHDAGRRRGAVRGRARERRAERRGGRARPRRQRPGVRAGDGRQARRLPGGRAMTRDEALARLRDQVASAAGPSSAPAPARASRPSARRPAAST